MNNYSLRDRIKSSKKSRTLKQNRKLLVYGKMDEEAFRKFLKRDGRSASTADNVLSIVRGYEEFLRKLRQGKGLDQATPSDLEAFTSWYEETKGKSAKRQLWGIRYYYRFTTNEELRNKTSELRERRTARTRKPFRLKEFRGVNTDYVEKLNETGASEIGRG